MKVEQDDYYPGVLDVTIRDTKFIGGYNVQNPDVGVLD